MALSNRNVFIAPDNESGGLQIIFLFEDLTVFTKFVQVLTEAKINFTVENDGKEHLVLIPANFTEENADIFDTVFKVMNVAKKTKAGVQTQGGKALKLAGKAANVTGFFLGKLLDQITDKPQPQKPRSTAKKIPIEGIEDDLARAARLVKEQPGLVDEIAEAFSDIANGKIPTLDELLQKIKTQKLKDRPQMALENLTENDFRVAHKILKNCPDALQQIDDTMRIMSQGEFITLEKLRKKMRDVKPNEISEKTLRALRLIQPQTATPKASVGKSSKTAKKK